MFRKSESCPALCTTMNILLMLLALYLAATLGVSGLAKAAQPAYFSTTLRQQGLLPAWSISVIGWSVPWLELVLAGALISGVAALPISVLTLALFVGFGVVKLLLYRRQVTVDCGCYGPDQARQVDASSLAVVGVQIGLATLHLGFVAWLPIVVNGWRLGGLLLFAGLVSVVLWRAKPWHQRQLMMPGASMHDTDPSAL